MIVTQTTPPAYLPLTLTEAKLHLRVDGTAEDALIPSLIGAGPLKVRQVTLSSPSPAAFACFSTSCWSCITISGKYVSPFW